ncbi:MAG: ATP-binding protein [Oscillatoriales cyanobacterium]|nr:MAG: ATP-binding protein [Oscillatoriales cyanobacterium]
MSLANVSVNVCPDLQRRLLTEFEKRYKKPGRTRARTGELIVHWQNRIDPDRSPSDQAVLNLLKGKRNTSELWLVDGLCRLLLGYSYAEWGNQFAQEQYDHTLVKINTSNPNSDFVAIEGIIAPPSLQNLIFLGHQEAIAPGTPHRHSLHQLPYCNLPKQDNEFIGRQSDLKHLLKLISLNHRAPIITVDGIGGVGKTALVVEAAYQSWEAKHGIAIDAPIFDAIIFVSAKENYLLPNGIVPRLQRESTLRDIFRLIASTLEDQTITQSAPEEQLNRVYESLGRQKTLLIIDNLETITEKNEILAFLSDLPPSTKAVITTREQVVMYAPIRLNCLPEADSLLLILQQSTEKGVTLNDEQSRRLYNRFGGVPIALIYAIGQLASSYSIEMVLDKSSLFLEDIAHFCFHTSVQPLRGKPAQKLLMSLAIFSEDSTWDAVTEVAGLKRDPINANKGLAQLQQLSLIRQQEGRYEMLSLTREYALGELAANSDFEQEARERWVRWYLDFAQRYGQEEWHEWHIHYDRLEAEGANLLAMIEWLAVQERYQDVKDLWNSLKNYSHIYGYWEDRLFWMQ